MATSTIPAIRRRPGVHRFPVPLLALAPALLALFAAGAGTALAQEVPAGEATLVSLDRLKFEFKCYFNIPEWKGRGEETFLKKLSDQKTAYKTKQAASVPAIEGLMAEGYWKRKTEFEAGGNEDGADEMAGLVVKLESKDDPIVKGYRTKAQAYLIEKNFAAAQKLEAGGQLAEARVKFASIVGADDLAIGQKSVTSLVNIIRKQKNYQAVVDSNELADIGPMLQSVLAELKSDLGDTYEEFLKGTGGKAVNAELKALDVAREKNEKSTQKIEIRWRDVAAAMAGVQGTIDDTAAATFSLTPEGTEGMPFPAKGGSGKFKSNPTLWYRGTYTVRAFAAGSTRPFAVLRGVSVVDAPGVVEIPNRVPAGMVWVPPLKAGGEALFIDRFETTVALVEAVAGSDAKLAGVVSDSKQGGANGDTPAWFAEEAQVQAFAKASGKGIPTVAQWQHAAFGGKSAAESPFPWGKEDPDSSRVFVAKGVDRPDTVGRRPAGAAACGAEDMAGNLCEWVLSDGQLWVIGANYLMVDGIQQFEGKFPLRDPMPGTAVYASWAGTDRQNQFLKYRYKEDDGFIAGVRTVVVVAAK